VKSADSENSVPAKKRKPVISLEKKKKCQPVMGGVCQRQSKPRLKTAAAAQLSGEERKPGLWRRRNDLQ